MRQDQWCGSVWNGLWHGRETQCTAVHSVGKARAAHGTGTCTQDGAAKQAELEDQEDPELGHHLENKSKISFLRDTTSWSGIKKPHFRDMSSCATIHHLLTRTEIDIYLITNRKDNKKQRTSWTQIDEVIPRSWRKRQGFIGGWLSALIAPVICSQNHNRLISSIKLFCLHLFIHLGSSKLRTTPETNKKSFAFVCGWNWPENNLGFSSGFLLWFRQRHEVRDFISESNHPSQTDLLFHKNWKAFCSHNRHSLVTVIICLANRKLQV